MSKVLKQVLIAILIASILWLSTTTYSNSVRIAKMEIAGIYGSRDVQEIKTDLKEIKKDIKDLLKERRD